MCAGDQREKAFAALLWICGVFCAELFTGSGGLWAAGNGGAVPGVGAAETRTAGNGRKAAAVGGMAVAAWRLPCGKCPAAGTDSGIWERKSFS